MNQEEIVTLELQAKKEELSKKLVEIKEIMDSVKTEIDRIGEEENNVWYSLSSKYFYEQFSNDYRKFIEFDDSFHSIVDFLDQVSTGYEEWNQKVLENINNIEDTKIS